MQTKWVSTQGVFRGRGLFAYCPKLTKLLPARLAKTMHTQRKRGQPVCVEITFLFSCANALPLGGDA